MAKVNLLPWREERRQELKQEFLVVLAGMAVIAGGLVFLAHSYVDGLIVDQNARNGYLTKHINELNKQVKEIKKLEKEKRELLARMKVIQDLQGRRPVIVRIFDEMVRTLPDGVFYQSLQRKGNKINIKGTSESNSRISSLMRRLDTSEWFSSPNLTDVSALPSYGDQASKFQLSFKIRKSTSVKEDK